MTLPSSGALSINDILLELGRSSGESISSDDPELYTLSGKNPGDPLIFPTDFYGKSLGFSFVAQNLPYGLGVGFSTGSYSIFLNGNSYTVTSIYINGAGNLFIGISYDGGPSLAASELSINIEGTVISTSSVGNGGGETGINWEILSSELNGLTLVAGNTYFVNISIESTNPFGLVDHVVHRMTVYPEREKSSSGNYISDDSSVGSGFGFHRYQTSNHPTGSGSDYQLPVLGLRGVTEPDLFISTFRFNNYSPGLVAYGPAIGEILTVNPDSGVAGISGAVAQAIQSQYRNCYVDLRAFHAFDGSVAQGHLGCARLSFDQESTIWGISGNLSTRPTSSNTASLVNKIKAVSIPDNAQGSFEVIMILTALTVTQSDVINLIQHYRDEDGYV